MLEETARRRLAARGRARRVTADRSATSTAPPMGGRAGRSAAALSTPRTAGTLFRWALADGKEQGVVRAVTCCAKRRPQPRGSCCARSRPSLRCLSTHGHRWKDSAASFAPTPASAPPTPRSRFGEDCIDYTCPRPQRRKGTELVCVVDKCTEVGRMAGLLGRVCRSWPRGKIRAGGTSPGKKRCLVAAP